MIHYITTDVPHRYVLGLILFHIYIANFTNIIR